MLPVIELECEKFCETRIALFTRRTELVGDAYSFDWQAVTHSAQI